MIIFDIIGYGIIGIGLAFIVYAFVKLLTFAFDTLYHNDD